ncbi:hypothetical protein ETI08_03545 [Macrococcoides goetzii]|nr:hypothetical protein [Macrococcus goetzii]TDM48225.1 hypothetical protein ETI08_03545 [Macrococcus goetzii]
MYTPTEIEQIIKDYHWMTNIIETNVFNYDTSLTAQYGVESSMPKAQGQTSDKVFMRVLKNDKQGQKYKKLVEKVQFVDEHEDIIENEKDFYILQLLKRGKNFKQVAVFMECSHVNIYHRLQKIAKQMAEVE